MGEYLRIKGIQFRSLVKLYERSVPFGIEPTKDSSLPIVKWPSETVRKDLQRLVKGGELVRISTGI